MSDKPRVLFVDDEENILKAIQRSLRRDFDVATANSGKEGLELLKNSQPFEVIVSDMKMPEMNGATFLRHVARSYPQSVRVLLTGFAQLDNVVAAVNEGHIYRFLGKPISGKALTEAINDSVQQHRLQTAEKVLLEQTLTGSIHALTEVLSMANPSAFGRGTRIGHLATVLAAQLNVDNMWQVEVASTLSQIGCITLPQETALKWYNGDELTKVEEMMVAKIPEMTSKVLGTIPRLEEVMEILKYQGKNFDGSGLPRDKVAGEDIPLGSRILRLAIRIEDLQTRGATPGMIRDDLNAHKKQFDPNILKIYLGLTEHNSSKETVRGVTLNELRVGMVFTEDVKSEAGLLLVANGQVCTESLLERIQNYEATIGLRLPMWIENPDYIDPESQEALELAEKMKEKELDETIGETQGAAAFLEVD